MFISFMLPSVHQRVKILYDGVKRLILACRATNDFYQMSFTAAQYYRIFSGEFGKDITRTALTCPQD